MGEGKGTEVLKSERRKDRFIEGLTKGLDLFSREKIAVAPQLPRTPNEHGKRDSNTTCGS